jgi:cation diffusion facilitator family transporter
MPVDPLITLLFSFGILYGSGKIIRRTIGILMESAPAHIDPDEMEKELAKIPGVKEIHDLHIWSISPKKIAMSAHIVAEDTQSALRAAHELVKKKYGLSYMTLQVEDPAHFEAKYCYDLQNDLP